MCWWRRPEKTAYKTKVRGKQIYNKTYRILISVGFVYIFFHIFHTIPKDKPKVHDKRVLSCYEKMHCIPWQLFYARQINYTCDSVGIASEGIAWFILSFLGPLGCQGRAHGTKASSKRLRKEGKERIGYLLEGIMETGQWNLDSENLVLLEHISLSWLNDFASWRRDPILQGRIV